MVLLVWEGQSWVSLVLGITSNRRFDFLTLHFLTKGDEDELCSYVMKMSLV